MPGNIDGISFDSELFGGKKQEKHEFLYWENLANGGQQAVRFGKWKAICQNINTENNLKFKLFNLENDIRELHDVSDQYPEIMKTIERI